jgi:DNA-binding MarR family transcriptional regulator
VDSEEPIGEIRSFNRFYTRVLGVLERHILRSPYSLTEARILFEISHDHAANARKIRKLLVIDEGYLSRTIDKLLRQGLILKERSPTDGRVLVLSLSMEGKRIFARLDRESAAEMGLLIRHLSVREVSELVAHMRRIRRLLSKAEEQA